MDSNRPGSTPAPDDPRLIAKLRGLERMWMAGLIDEHTYQTKLAALQRQLEGTGGGSVAPSRPGPRPVLRREAPPLPPRPEVMAPPPLVVSTPPPRPVLPPLPAPEAAEAPVEPAAEPEAPVRPGSPGLRRVVIASLVGVAVVLAGGITTVLLLRAHSTGSSTDLGASSAPGQTPDVFSALLARRMAVPSRGGAVMDAPAAEKLVRAYWPVREKVLGEHDTLAVRQLETGAAAQWDAVGCTSGCGTQPPRALEALNVFVPKQFSYPAAFLAEALTTEYQHRNTAMLELMVFTRPSAGSPWSLALDTGYTGAGSLQEFPVPEEGGDFDAAAPDVAGVDQLALPSALAAYLQHWADTGAAPAGSPLRDGTYTSSPASALHEQVIEDRNKGVAASFSFTAGSPVDGVWSFAVRQEASADTGVLALTCGVVRYTMAAAPLHAGGSLVQDQGFSPFGTLLAPGSYRQVTELGLHQSCFLSGPGLQGVTVLGNNGATVRATGVSS